VPTAVCLTADSALTLKSVFRMACLDSAKWEWGRPGPFCKSPLQFFNAYKVCSDSSCPKDCPGTMTSPSM